MQMEFKSILRLHHCTIFGIQRNIFGNVRCRLNRRRFGWNGGEIRSIVLILWRWAGRRMSLGLMNRYGSEWDLPEWQLL